MIFIPRKSPLLGKHWKACDQCNHRVTLHEWNAAGWSLIRSVAGLVSVSGSHLLVTACVTPHHRDMDYRNMATASGRIISHQCVSEEWFRSTLDHDSGWRQDIIKRDGMRNCRQCFHYCLPEHGVQTCLSSR